MASRTINIKYTTSFDAKGVKAAEDALRRLAQQYGKFPFGGGGGSGGGGKGGPADPLKQIPPAAGKAEAAILRLASAQARLQSAQGNAAGAIKTLSSALAQVDKSSVAAIRAQTQLTQAQNALAKSAQQASGGVAVLPRTLAGLSHEAARAVKVMGGLALAMAGLRSAVQVVKGVADFEETLSVLQATSGATEEQMAAVAAQSRALGADLGLPATSAGTAAAAMLELTKAGFSVEQAIASSRGVLQLAASDALNEAEAAEYAAAAINQFGIEHRKAGMIADLYAATASASAVGVRDVAQAVEQGGAVFAAYQTDVVGADQALRDFSTAVGIMGNAGIKGMKAGTALQAAMTMVAAPSDKAKGVMIEVARAAGEMGDVAFDATGKMRSLPEMMDVLRRGTAGMTEEMRAFTLTTIFGRDAASAILPLLAAGADGWETMADKVDRAGAAQELAGARMRGLNGAVASLQSQMETLAQSAIEPFLPLMAELVQGAAQLAGDLQGPVSTGAAALAEHITRVATIIQDGAIPAMAAAATAAGVYATMQSATLIPAVTAATGAILTNTAAIVAAAAPYAAIAIAIGLVATAYSDYQQQLESGTQTLLESRQWWTDSATALDQYKTSLDLANNSGVQLSQGTQSAAATVQTLRDMVERQTEALARASAEYETFGAASGYSREQLDAEMQKLNQLSDGLKDATGHLENLTAADMQQITASMTATNVLDSQRSSTETLGDQAALSADKIQELGEAIAKNFQSGAEAVGEAITSQNEFIVSMEAMQAAHKETMARLTEEKNQAQTAAEQQGAQDRITAAQAGYAQEVTAAVEAYGKIAAAQRAALGQRINEYIIAQTELGNIDNERAAQLIEANERAFGIVEDSHSATYLRMIGHVDEYAANANTKAETTATAMKGQIDAAANAARAADEATKPRYAEVASDFIEERSNAEALAQAAASVEVPRHIPVTSTAPQQRVLMDELAGAAQQAATPRDVRITSNAPQATSQVDALLGRLNAIPRTVTTQHIIQTIEQNTTRPGGSGATKGFAGGGNPPTGEVVLVGEEGPELVVFGSSATVIPAPQTAQIVKHGMSEGGDVGNGATTTGVPVGPSVAVAIPIVSSADMDKALADQQKVNNKLRELQDDYIKDSLEAERDYQERRADIINDFEKRLAQQLQRNELSKFETRADFYDALTQATKEIGQEQAQSLAAEFESGQQRVRELEQQGMAEQAANQEAFYAKRLAAELNYATEVARIKADGVTAEEQAELDRMAAIKAMRDQGMEAELNQIEQGGDALVNARDESLNEAEASYQEQQAELTRKATEAMLEHAGVAQQTSIDVTTAVQNETNAVNALINALNSVPASKTVEVKVNYSETGTNPTSTVQAAGGGNFLTTGPTTLTVGDNPGGVEMVSVTPISGSGTTKVSGGVIHLAGGGTVTTAPTTTTMTTTTTGSSSVAAAQLTLEEANEVIKALAGQIDWELLGTLNVYRQQVEAASAILRETVSIIMQTSQPLPPVDPEAVAQLADETKIIVETFNSRIVADVWHWGELTQAYSDLVGNAVGILQSTLDVRADLEQAGDLSPINYDQIAQLADDGAEISRVISSLLIPYASYQAAQLEAYQQEIDASVSILRSIIAIRKEMVTPTSPLDPALIEQMAADAQMATVILQNELLASGTTSTALLEQYAETVSNGVGILSDVIQLARDTVTGTPPLDPEVIQDLADASVEVTTIIANTLQPTTEEQLEALQQWQETVGASVQVLSDVARLGEMTAATPLNPAVFAQLAADAQGATWLILNTMLPLTAEQEALLHQWQASVGASVQVLTDVAALHDVAEQAATPLNPEVFVQLAEDAQGAVWLISTTLLPMSEEEVAALQQWQASVGAAVQVLDNVANLHQIDPYLQPLNPQVIVNLAEQASGIVDVVYRTLLPMTEEQAAALQIWADVTGSAVQVLSDVAGLAGQELIQPPIPQQAIDQLADDAQRIAHTVTARMLPASQEQADALQLWADATGASVDTLKNVIGLSGDLFADYHSPTDAQLNLLVTDAQRVVSRVEQAARTYSTSGLEAAKLYADAVGGTFGAFKEGLIFFDALRSGEYTLDMDKLMQFEHATLATLDTMRRLGAEAATIPQTDIAALQTTTAALQAQADALLALSAVPYETLHTAYTMPLLTSGSGTTINATIYVYSESADPSAVAHATVTQLNNTVNSYA